MSASSSNYDQDDFEKPPFHYEQVNEEHTWKGNGFRNGKYYKSSEGSSSSILAESRKHTIGSSTANQDGSIPCCLWNLPDVKTAKNAYNLFHKFERKVAFKLASEYILKPVFQDEEKLVFAYPYFKYSLNDWYKLLVEDKDKEKARERIIRLMRKIIKIGCEMDTHGIHLTEGKTFFDDGCIAVINDEPVLVYCPTLKPTWEIQSNIRIMPFIMVFIQMMYGITNLTPSSVEFPEPTEAKFKLDEHVQKSIAYLKSFPITLVMAEVEEKEARIWDSIFYASHEKTKVILDVYDWFHTKWGRDGAQAIDDVLKLDDVFKDIEKKKYKHCYFGVYNSRSRDNESAIEFARDCIAHFRDHLRYQDMTGTLQFNDDDIAELLDMDFDLIRIIRTAVIDMAKNPVSPVPLLSSKRWKQFGRKELWKSLTLSGVAKKKDEY